MPATLFLFPTNAIAFRFPAFLLFLLERQAHLFSFLSRSGQVHFFQRQFLPADQQILFLLFQFIIPLLLLLPVCIFFFIKRDPHFFFFFLLCDDAVFKKYDRFKGLGFLPVLQSL